MRKHALVRLALAILLCAVLGFLAWPAPFHAQAWRPSPLPPLHFTDDLSASVLWGRGEIHGPEDVAVDARGRVYTGLADGRIVRLDGQSVQTLARTGGRPLGLILVDAQHLVVCDAWRGLLRVGIDDGRVEVLSHAAEGLPFGFTDDLAAAADGRIYFSDASSRWHQPDYMMDLLEGHPYGRLLVYDPQTRQTHTLLRGLYFANGVAMTPDDAAVLVVESFRYRIRRYWLKGAAAGTTDIFADNLPGIPDNIDVDARGHVWVALPTPRRFDIDAMMASRWLRERTALLPLWLRPGPSHVGLLAELDAQGHLLHLHRDADGEHLRMITSVLPDHDRLIIGSLENDRVGVLHLPAH